MSTTQRDEKPAPSDGVGDDLSGLPDHIVLYDGVCGLCHRGVRSLMGLDRDRILHFAPLQGETAARLGIVWEDDGPASADTFVFVDNTGPEPVHHERMDGVAAELRAIGRLAPVAAIIRHTPKRIADGAYKVIAASRYRLFGKFDQCELPTRSQRERFLP
ncbi:thiol-disulfide oxidoreductase DCC family protein [Actinospongicola halichondriae]|uniref:thiol-disulfide oxidoreductase DCC family protein n=1 Tax=Actinospongicola halichondriae TaxID=3236844 RepID=UPI003D5A9868